MKLRDAEDEPDIPGHYDASAGDPPLPGSELDSGLFVVPLPMLKLVLDRLYHSKLDANNRLGPLPRSVLRAAS
jgi:hypothetical protein